MKKFLLNTSIVAVLFSCNKSVIEVESSACFDYEDKIHLINELVDFENCSFNAKRYEWNFGDGEESTFKYPQHLYKKPDKYSVELISYDEYNNQNSYIKEIEVKGININKLQLIPKEPNGHSIISINRFDKNLFLSEGNKIKNVYYYDVLTVGYLIENELEIEFYYWANPDCTGNSVYSFQIFNFNDFNIDYSNNTITIESEEGLYTIILEFELI